MMRKLLWLPVAWFAIGAISITVQDVRDARFRRRHGLHPYWRTHRMPTYE